MRRLKRLAAIVGAVVIGLTALIVVLMSFPGSRATLLTGALLFVIWQRGYHLAGGNISYRTGVVIATNLIIKDNRDEVFFSGKRVVIRYDPAVFTGRSYRRYGLQSIAMDEPRVRLVRRDDGSWNFGALSGPSAPPPAPGAAPAPAPGNVVPYRFHALVNHGALEVVDPQAAKPGRLFSLAGIYAHLTFNGGGRSSGELNAALHTSRGDALVLGSFLEDDVASFGHVTIRAHAVPIAPVVDAFAPSHAFAMEMGLADVALQAYAIDYGASPDWHVSGKAAVRSMRVLVIPLIVPVRDLAGSLTYHDGWLSARELKGTAAGVPLTATGGIQLTGGVRLALAVRQRGVFERSRALLAFSQRRPVSGPFQVAVRVDGPVGDIRAAGAFVSHETRFATGRLRDLRGSFFYDAGHLTVSGLDVGSDNARLWLEGDVDLNAPELSAEAILQANVPAREVPFAANINSDGTLSALGTFNGPILELAGSGYGRLTGGNGQQVQAFFSGGPGGVSFGPLLYRARGGEMLLVADLIRPAKSQPMWRGEIVASHAPVRVRGGSVALVDVGGVAASLPSLDTVVDGVAVVDGSGPQPDIAIDSHASGLVLQGVDFGDARVIAGGSNGHLHIVQATLRGGSAQATAHGDLLVTPRFTVGGAVLAGTGDMDLSALEPAFPSLHPKGQLSGSFSAVSSGTGWILGTQAHSANASLAGASLTNARAVLQNTGTRTSVLAHVGGADTNVWAVGNIERASNATAVAHLRAFAPHIGLSSYEPRLHNGSAVAFASIDGNMAAPGVAAAATVRGTFDKQPVSGDLDLRYAGTTLRSNESRIALLGNRAIINGSINGVRASGSSVPSLALEVSVREGDLSALNRVTGTRAPLTGSFDAQVRIGGTQSAPQLDGRVATDLGTIRGVAFNDLRGHVSAGSGVLTLSGGSVLLGSSEFALDGDVARRSFRVKATSPHVDMTDFNDFFGGADVFGGTGDFTIGAASNNGALAWDGVFVLDNASLRDYPLGYINADLDSRAGTLRAAVQQSGSVGATSLTGTARFRRTASGLPDFKTASYRLRVKLQQIDLAATLPLIHQENLGLSGRLDAEGQMAGTLRNPIGTAKFEMRGGHMRHTSIDFLRGTLSSDAYGVTLTSGDLTLPYLTASGEGRYTFDRERIGGKATLRAADLSSLSTAMRVPGALGGSAIASVSVSGTLRRPLVSASVDAGRSTVYGIGFDRANINATYAPGQVRIGNTLLAFAGNSGLLSITGELPLQLQPLALGPKNRPIGLTMRAEKVDLAVLNPIIKRYMTLTGNLNIGASITGSAGNPVGNGTAQIRYATVHSPIELVPLTNLTADIGFKNDTVSVHTHASAGKGIVDVQGSAHVVPAEGLRSNAGLQFSTRVGLHGAEVDFPGWLRGTLDGSLDVTRSGLTPYVEGAVTASNAVVPFSAIYALATGGAAGATVPAQAPGVPHLRPGHTIVYGGSVWGTKPQILTTIGGPTPAPTGVSLPPVDVRVAVTAGNNVRVRGGNAIDLTTTGGVVIAGNLRAPTLDGQFYAVRGQVGYFDTNFRLVSGVVTFDPNAGLLPTMDVTAVTNASGAEITLHITGRVDNLSTELSSNPPMTRDEIVATLLHAPQLASLTNSTSTSTSAQSTLTQTAQNYFNAELSRSLLYPFESALAQQLNIESVSLIFNPQGNLAIEVRKRFTNSISAVYQTTVSVPTAQSYGVSYRLRDYLSLDLIQAQPTLSTTTNAATSAYAYTTINLRYQFH